MGVQEMTNSSVAMAMISFTVKMAMILSMLALVMTTSKVV